MAFWRSKKSETTNEEAEPSGQQESGRPEGSIESKPASQPNSGGGLFAKMRGGLAKTRQVLSTDIRDLFKGESQGRLVDDEFLDELFARLVRTDMGVGRSAMTLGNGFALEWFT